MIIIADAKGRSDGPAYRMLENVKTDLPIVLMARTNGFKFNEELRRHKRYILFCFTEYGWDWDLDKSGTQFWGHNYDRFTQLHDNEEYKRFDDWVAENPPAHTFKRELLRQDVKENVSPVDYPCWFPRQTVNPKNIFDTRPIQALYYFGRSHEERIRLHADIWMNAYKRGASVCDTHHKFEQFMFEEKGELWASMWMPHYSRIDISNLLLINMLSKFCITLPGAGIKTFRHTEASYNSVMIKWKDNLAWSYPWQHEINCIDTTKGNEIEDIYKYVDNPGLYEIYCEGVNNCSKYYIEDYVKNYLQPIINAV